MTSSRLPGKHLLEVLDKPIIYHLIQRLKKVKLLDEVVVAITDNQTDDVLENYLNSIKVNTFRGSEENVMHRVIAAADYYSADIICEVTGDCPLVDPNLVANLLENFLSNSPDYACNGTTGLPDGMGAQVFTINSIKKSYGLTSSNLDREHVTLHIRNNPMIFKHLVLGTPKSLFWPDLGLTLDEYDDYKLINQIFERFRDRPHEFSCLDILKLLKKNQELISINNKVIRKGDS